MTPLLIAGYLLTVALHGGLFLLAAWVIERSWRVPQGAWREMMWRCALFGGVITAGFQPLGGAAPLAARWHVDAVAKALGAISGAISLQSAPAPKLDAAQNSAHPQTPAPGVSSTASRAEQEGLTSAARLVPSLNSGSAQRAEQHMGPRDLQSAVQSAAWIWPAWIVGIWLTGALLALTRQIRNLLRLRQALSYAAPVTSPDLANDLAALARRARIREPHLYSAPDIASPLAVTGERIILPAWAVQSLDHGQLRAMLAHELAHIARRDPQWKLLTAFWRALFWFLPLASVAQCRLDDEAELACDAFAARHTGNARSVAECLAACAEHLALDREIRTSTYELTPYELAPAMAARQSSLIHRIECLLEGVSMETVAPGVRTRVVAFIVLASSALSLPAITFLDSEVAHAAQPQQEQQQPLQPQQPQQPQQPKSAAEHESHSNWNVHIDDDKGRDITSVRVSDADHTFSANIEGKIAFSDDETDVASLGTGGTATFEETRAGVTRRMELNDRNGKLERRYFVDHKEQPLDASARAWLAALVPALIRETGIDAQARVQRIYAAGGAARVLDEIERIHSDYVRSIYLKLLVDLGPLAPAELDRTVKLAGDVRSDYERRQALSKIFATQMLSAAQQVTFLRQALHFKSDFERAELLVGVVPKLVNTAEVRQAWLDAALGVSSDYERRRTLASMLALNGLDDHQLGSIIDASASMGSDYEHRELLIEIARRAHDIDALAPAYTHATQAIHSDYERREALLALIHAGKLGPNSIKAVLDSAAQIHSEYECREVLVALARVMPNDSASIARYHEVAGHLSNNERDEAERALVR